MCKYRYRFALALVLSIFLGACTISNLGAGGSTLPSNGSINYQVGTVTAVSTVVCPGSFDLGMTCEQATVNCPNTQPLTLTFGYKTPAGAVVGTILAFSGGSGTSPFSQGNGVITYTQSFYNAGYQVVQTAWSSDWQIVGGTYTPNIKVAACRPATILNYVYQNIHGGEAGAGGMCAMGYSAGSAALGYSLTWYNSGSYLDKAMFFSGPVLSDIEQGCSVPNAPNVSVCPASQYGCTGAPWTDHPYYTTSAITFLQNWAGDPTCNGGSPTSSQSNSNWKSMSIVDGTSNGSFNYPKTAVSAWLCSNGGNNSAAQAELYFQNFTSGSQTAAYSVNRVDGCAGAEGIWSGTNYLGQSAYTASVNDMLDSTVGCVKRH